MRLIGASLAWACMDFAYYGNTVSSPMVLAAMSPNKSLLDHTLMQLAIFAIAAAPGYLIAAATMDRIGRKSIQMVGFVMMAVAFALIALIPDVEHLAMPFLIIYGVSYFFTEFGPNSTTFVYPAEIFPVRARTTGHGIAAAIRQARRLPRRVPLPDLHGLARPSGGRRRRGRRQRGRRDRDSDDAAGNQGQEPRGAQSRDRGRRVRSGASLSRLFR